MTFLIRYIIEMIFLGKKETLTQLLGCIIYPLAITFTAPLAKLITIELEPHLMLYVIAAICHGIGAGIIYRAGFSTGGFDIITQILSNKMKKPITKISPVLNMMVLTVGGFILNPVKIMYALMIIFISNKVTNGILFSISINPSFFGSW